MDGRLLSFLAIAGLAGAAAVHAGSAEKTAASSKPPFIAGTRVTFAVQARNLYSAKLPVDGTEGTIVVRPIGPEKKVLHIPGPRGGLVFVRVGSDTISVSPEDLKRGDRG